MARKPSTAKEAEIILTQDIMDAVYADLGELGKTVDKVMQAAYARFFTMLVVKGIDVGSAPKLGPYTVKWKGLSDGWIQRKEKHGGSPNHYSGLSFMSDSSEPLQTFLEGSDAKTILGKPVSYLTSSRGTLAVNALGNGRKKYSQVGSAGPLDAKELMRKRFSSVKISIDPYPHLEASLDSNVRSGLIEQEVFGEGNPETYKLTNNKVSRPILVPYMKWFSRVYIKQQLLEKL